MTLLFTDKLQKAVHPEFLKDVTSKGLHQMCSDYRRLTRCQRRGLCALLVDMYHVQKNVKDPLLAVYELMQRLVYEVRNMNKLKIIIICLFCIYFS